MDQAVLVRGLTGAPRSVLLAGGRVAALDDDADARAGSARTVEVDGLRAVPGFIELQVNGIGTDDFTSDPSAIWRAGGALARHGVTSFLPTIVSSPPGTVEAALDVLADPPDAPPGAAPIGLHAEGPFISPARRGAHDVAHLRSPDLVELSRWIDRGVRLVTIAPELSAALEAIELIANRGAVAAIGHTDADSATTVEAIERGATYATHLFNAMPPLAHRAPGPVGAILADSRVTVGLIADGVHVDRTVLTIAARAAAGPISLVSDMIGASLGDAAVSTDGRRADGTLAGSSHGLDHGVRMMAGLVGETAALDAVTAVPARLLGLDDGRGTLRVGGRADLCLLTPGMEIAATVVGGRPVHVTFGVRWD